MALCRLSNVDRALIDLQSFDDLYLRAVTTKIVLMYAKTQEGPDNSVTKCHNLVDAGRFCTYSRFTHVCRDNSQSWNVLLLKEEALSYLGTLADMLIIRLPSVFNLMSFSCTATYSLTSQFLKKSLKGTTKSSLRQRSHSGMQAWGLAPSN